MTTILTAKPIIEDSKKTLKTSVSRLKAQGIVPTLKIIQVGSDPASSVYIKSKIKMGKDLGISVEHNTLHESIPQEDFINIIQNINSAPDIHGIIIQLPVPDQLKNLDIGGLINPEKDVDCFSPEHLVKIFAPQAKFLPEQLLLPCTPRGILKMFSHYKIPIEKKNVSIIGRSNIVGRPLASILTNLNCTVTLCHSHTIDLKEILANTDIIISATGSKHLIKRNLLNSERKYVFIDVGISREDSTLYGDISYNDVLPYAHAITPVPGGVGPLTVLSLFENLIMLIQTRND